LSDQCGGTAPNVIIIIIIIIINVDAELTERRSKCEDLEIEAIRIWKVRTKIVPVTVGALGIMKKGFRSEPSVARRSAVGHRATGHRTAEHCTLRL